MEKRLLSYAFLHHLKLGKCVINNCILCCSMRLSCRHFIGSYGPSNNNTEFSHSDDNPLEFPKSCGNQSYVMKQQLKNLDKGRDCKIKHSYSSNQSELMSFEKSDKAVSYSLESEDQVSYLTQSFLTKSHLNTPERDRMSCFGSLMHKAYLNLKNSQLLTEQQNSDIVTCPTNEMKQQKMDSHAVLSSSSQDIHAGYMEISLQSEIFKRGLEISDCVPETNRSSVSCNPAIKDLFKHNMYYKYQFPTHKEADRLLAMFPEPEKLLADVIKPLVKADKTYAPCLTLTDHLQGFYWKAHLTWSWPQKIVMRGIHPDKDLAIQRAYLQMCEHFKCTGLIYQSEDGTWVPMTCDKVTAMLELLSKYGESSLGCSKGRGFKIILEQVKERKNYTKDNVDDEEYNNTNKVKSTDNNSVNRLVGKCVKKIIDPEYYEGGTDSVIANESMFTTENLEKYFGLRTGTSSNICTNDVIQEAKFSAEMESIDADSVHLDAVDSSVKHGNKPRWICKIHVGWPFPFSVQAVAFSLPAAQMMGYLSAVNKLKTKELLTTCNSSVSRVNIEWLMRARIQSDWATNLKLMANKTSTEKFNADAEIFCDASIRGFGAFLSLKGTQKVSWLSEGWEEHQFNIHHLLDRNQHHLQSMLAELFTVVTAVFTWKHKLRGSRLICFSDNLIAMCLINSLTSQPLTPGSTSINSMDYLIHTLQSTCQDYSIKCQATWLDRHENWLADRLSRNDIVTFQTVVPGAAFHRTKAKKLKIREGTYTC